jgi:hypothetical protein
MNALIPTNPEHQATKKLRISRKLSTEKQNTEREEAARWRKEASDMLAPPGTHTKGSHEYPSVSGGPSLFGAKPLTTVSRKPFGVYETDEGDKAGE